MSDIRSSGLLNPHPRPKWFLLIPFIFNDIRMVFNVFSSSFSAVKAPINLIFRPIHRNHVALIINNLADMRSSIADGPGAHLARCIPFVIRRRGPLASRNGCNTVRHAPAKKLPPITTPQISPPCLEKAWIALFGFTASQDK